MCASAQQFHHARLLDAGVAILGYPAMLHAKAFVRDGEHVLAGTCNLEAWSLKRFFEIDLEVRSTGLAAQFDERFLGPAADVSTPGRAVTGLARARGVDSSPKRADPFARPTSRTGPRWTVFPEGMADPANSQAVLIRYGGADFRRRPGRETWTVDDCVAYSRVCTHAGCPVGLYEATPTGSCARATSRCSTSLDGARPEFGPATRPLPQLPLDVDAGWLPRRAERLRRAGRPGVLGPLMSDRGPRQSDRLPPAAPPLTLRLARAHRRPGGRRQLHRARRSARSSPTTSRSCSARSRSTASWCWCSPACYLTFFFQPSSARGRVPRQLRAAARACTMSRGVRVGAAAQLRRASRPAVPPGPPLGGPACSSRRSSPTCGASSSPARSASHATSTGSSASRCCCSRSSTGSPGTRCSTTCCRAPACGSRSRRWSRSRSSGPCIAFFVFGGEFPGPRHHRAGSSSCTS